MQPRASYLYRLPNSLEIILPAFARIAAPGSLRELRKSLSVGGRAEAEREGSVAGIRGESPCASGSHQGGLVITLAFRKAYLGNDRAQRGEGTRFRALGGTSWLGCVGIAPSNSPTHAASRRCRLPGWDRDANFYLAVTAFRWDPGLFF